MKNVKSLTIELSKLRIVVSAPDFKLTAKQEAAIAQWWHNRIEAESAYQLGGVRITASKCGRGKGATEKLDTGDDL